MRLSAGSAISAGLLWLLPTTASAFCVGWDKDLPGYDPAYYSVEHEFRRAKFVVEAQVARETWLGEDGRPTPLQPPFQFGGTRPWGLDPYIGAYYDVRVLRAFKGKPGRELRLFSENTTARFWLTKGSTYLLFILESEIDPPLSSELTFDNCGNSAEFNKARPVFRSVQRLSRKR